jgi:hypothetical protein
MAKERVQVQGLGDVVPGIQPTIQRAGQYAVAQVRAAPVPVPRSKLLDLADTLKVGQDLLQQYGLAAKQEAEIFEEELSRKSPEEIQAMLKKSEGELDKLVRRDAIGWLTSPLNQKRKLRAVGQASSKLMMEQVYNRLENPEAGDEDLSTREIIGLVQQQFVGDNEGLSSSVFAQEGLQQAVNPQILPLSRQYDAQKSREAKAATVGPVLDTVYHLVNNSYDGESMSLFSDDFADQVQEQWGNLGAFNAEEQKAFLARTLQSLARDGGEVKADAFLEWASANLKIGNAKLSIVDQSELSTLIDRSAAASEQAEDKRRNDLATGLYNEYTQAHNAIQAKRTGTFNGKEYNSLTQLQLDAENIASYDPKSGMDNETLGLLTKNINTFVRSDVDPLGRQQQELLRDTTGLRFIQEAFMRDRISGFVQNNYSQLTNDPQTVDLQINANIEFQRSIQNKALDLIQSGMEVDEQQSQLLQFARDEDKRIFDKFQQDIITRAGRAEEEVTNKDRADSFLDEATNKHTTAADKSLLDKLFEKISTVTEDDYQVTSENLKVLANKQAPAEEKQKAMSFVMSYGVRDSAILAKQLQPNAWKVKPKKPTSTLVGPVAMENPGTPGVRYTAEEIEVKEQQWMNINGFLETFTNIETLKYGRAVQQDTVVIFNPTELAGRAKITRILTVDEIEAAKDITSDESMPDDVKRKAQLIGVVDIVQFVKDQFEFAKRLGLTK